MSEKYGAGAVFVFQLIQTLLRLFSYASNSSHICIQKKKKKTALHKEITFELIFDSNISIAVTGSFTTRRLFNGPLAVKCLKHPPNG